MSYYLLQIVSLLGGLALFLFGMDTMGKALERLAGGRLQNILAKMSGNIATGFLLGLAITAIIQSSSATTVMVVGFVNSGIMTLRQAIGVIMGANVGTTVTAWILSLTALEGNSFLVQIFKPATLAPLLGSIGICLFMFTKSKQKQGIGTILLGFMALMTGMDIMSDSMSFLKTEAWFADLMVSFSNPLLGILAGAVLTGIIQSSSASVGILQSLCATGAVSFATAVPIILGQNIGTCVTAMLSTVGANRGARRAALVHLYFNLVGTALFCLVFYGIGLFYPWAFLAEIAGPMDIALFHTCFNLSATAVLLPMNRLLEKLAYLTIPAEPIHQKPVLLDERLLATPAVAVNHAREVAALMLNTSYQAMEKAVTLTANFDPDVFEQVRALEKETDKYEDELGSYLVKLTGIELSTNDSRLLNTMLYSISDMERIGDHAWLIAKASKKMSENQINFSEAAKAELAVLERAVLSVISTTARAYTENDRDLLLHVEPQEQVVDVLVKEIKARHIRRLHDGLCTVEYGFVLEDLLTSYQRSADHCSNIAVDNLQVSENRYDTHEYLFALKSGSLEESAAFTDHFDHYREMFALAEESRKNIH